MITHLGISGLALIEELAVDFSPGFNVITGETGAGKSILIRALNLLMGNRAGAELVRLGRQAAVVTGVFEVSDGHCVLNELEKLGICRSEQIVIRRQVVASTGKSQAWINDIPVTAASLRTVSRHLIDIFSQFENQQLMDESSHIEYVDRLLSDGQVLSAVTQAAQRVFESVSAIDGLYARLENLERNRDYHQFRLGELVHFNPSEEEYERLSATVRRREELVGVAEVLGRVLSLLESDEGVLQILRELQRVVAKITHLSESFEGKLKVAIADLEELSFVANRSQDDSELENLETLQARLFTYQDLLRKNGVRDIAGLVNERSRLEKDMALLNTAEEDLGIFIRDLKAHLQSWEQVALDLTKQRQKAGTRICHEISSELKALAMADARFEVQWVEHESSLRTVAFSQRYSELMPRVNRVSPLGGERAVFRLGANPGEAAFSLSKIASGGELSRIMLALKKVLSSGADMCVMVFDEIDSGISGRVADIVGKKIRELSKMHQVLCISHLPQVSVYADAHLLVKKTIKGDRTESSLLRLSSEQSAKEIARMLSGEKISVSSLENAKALIERARKRLEKKSHITA